MDHVMRLLLAITLLVSLQLSEGDLEPTYLRCCTLGSNWASEGLKCSQFPAPVTGIPAEHQGICLSAVEICCIRTHREKMCEQGKVAAEEGKDCVVDKKIGGEFQKDCCEACKLGLISGSMGQSCRFSTFMFGAPWDNAHHACCLKTAPSTTSTATSTSTSTATSTSISTSTTTLSDTAGIPTPALDSLCELLPGELCAHICVPVPDSYRCECRPGFSLLADNKSCQLDDESADRCAVNNPCSQKCVDTGIAVECSCHSGFQLASDRRTCNDIDECQLKLHACEPSNQVCVNEPGSYSCTNKDGSKSKPQSRNDKRVNIGGDLAPGKCPPGYQFNAESQVCDDINECAEAIDNCNRERQYCLNTEGGFTCQDKTEKSQCPAGYKFNKNVGSCEDINECEELIHICNLESEACINEPGGYRCGPKLPETQPTSNQCQPGFRLHASQRGCVDVDECQEGDTPCDSNQVCRNTPGSYICSCRVGYNLDPLTQACVDVNECQVNEHECLPSQRCDNTIGSYHCIRFTSCGTGYTLNSQSGLCEDDDECVLRTDNCRFLGPVFQCRNTAGSFRCERKRCVGALKLNTLGVCVGAGGVAPVTIATVPTRATQRPSTTPLTCSTGFRLENGQCIDVNECEIATACRRNQRCVNTFGSYRCINFINCNGGYELNEAGTQCVDIDECSGRHECGSGQQCINRPGGYVCQCPSGHTVNQANECVDVDECTKYAGQVCSSNSVCRNTPGSYVCQCKPGFKQGKEANACEDVDECKESTGLCQHNCVNNWGSYKCSCQPGFTLSTDNRTCSDVNECDMFRDRHLCIGNCINQPGSYSCSCPDGYRLGTDGRTCQDIDECQGGSACPNPNELCFNTRGSYRCNTITCPQNFIKDTEHKNRCKRASLFCRDGDQTCLRMPLSYSYNYITFVSNLAIPPATHLDLFTMRGPLWQTTTARFNLEMLDSRAPNAIRKVTKNFFTLRNTAPNQAVISLADSIQGPQEIELQLTMDIYRSGEFGGSAVAKLFIYVSQYDY